MTWVLDDGDRWLIQIGEEYYPPEEAQSMAEEIIELLTEALGNGK